MSDNTPINGEIIPVNGKDPKTGQFLKGFIPNPNGRPVGARSKLGEAFLEAMQENFEKHGVDTIEEVRKERPHEYLKVIASLLPKDVNLEVSATEAFQRVLEALNEKAQDGLDLRIRKQRERSTGVRN